MIVNKAMLSDIIGKSQRTLTTWQKSGLPMVVDAQLGDANQYETVDVIRWLIARETARLKDDGSGRVLDYELERARLTHHQANKTELEEQALKGTLIPAEKVEWFQGNMVAAFRSKMLSLPTKAAHALIGIESLNEAQEVLREYIHEALLELSTYAPDQYGIESVEEDNGVNSSATGTDSQSVG